MTTVGTGPVAPSGRYSQPRSVTPSALPSGRLLSLADRWQPDPLISADAPPAHKQGPAGPGPGEQGGDGDDPADADEAERPDVERAQQPLTGCRSRRRARSGWGRGRG